MGELGPVSFGGLTLLIWWPNLEVTVGNTHNMGACLSVPCASPRLSEENVMDIAELQEWV